MEEPWKSMTIFAFVVLVTVIALTYLSRHGVI